MSGDVLLTDQGDEESDVRGNQFLTKNDEIVYIDASDPCDVRVRSTDGQEIGSFQFREIEYPSGPHDTEVCLHLCHMEIAASYRRQGIGRECILQARAESGASGVTASSEHARNLEDGSHLIGDGPAFVRAMAREGIVGQDGHETPDIDDD
jgi:GNAT superfamily N-acetyltransferase